MLFLLAFAVFFVLSVLPLAAFVLRHFGVFGQLFALFSFASSPLVAAFRFSTRRSFYLSSLHSLFSLFFLSFHWLRLCCDTLVFSVNFSRFFLSLPLHLWLPSDLLISFVYAVPPCIRCFLCSFCPSTGCVCAATLWCFRSTFRAFFFRFLSTCGCLPFFYSTFFLSFLLAFAVFFVLSVLPLAAFVLRHFGVFGQLFALFSFASSPLDRKSVVYD